MLMGNSTGANWSKVRRGGDTGVEGKVLQPDAMLWAEDNGEMVH